MKNTEDNKMKNITDFEDILKENYGEKEHLQEINMMQNL